MNRRKRKREERPRPDRRKKFISDVASSSECSDLSEDSAETSAEINLPGQSSNTQQHPNPENETADFEEGTGDNGDRDGNSNSSLDISGNDSADSGDVDAQDLDSPQGDSSSVETNDIDSNASNSAGHSSNDDAESLSLEEDNNSVADQDDSDATNSSNGHSGSSENEDEQWFDSESEMSVNSDHYEASSEEESEGVLSSEDEDQEDIGNVPLYQGAPLTLHQSLLAILTLATVEHISGILLAKILTLITLHCPLNNICKTTLYTFKKYFAKIGAFIVKCHYFCSNCIYPVESKSSVCPKCRNLDNSFFLEIPLVQQLQTLFKRRSFYEDLQYRFNPNRKKNMDNIEDIYDARIYKEQIENGFLRSPNSISFLAYWDGINTSRSSSFSVWPCYLVINELAYKQRISPRNILVVGLWFGKSKPSPNIFLRPLKNSLDVLQRQGCQVKLFDGREITVKGKVLCFTCDLPAKSKFLSFKQYNGFYGCAHCLTPGERFMVGPQNSVHVYPYERDTPLRTHKQTKVDAESAIVRRRENRRDPSVNGVKGLSLLYYMLPDIIRCMAIDIMHGVFLGVCKTLISLWFSHAYSRMPWTMYPSLEEIEERLKSIKLPSYVQRFPRSLKDVALWKASEFKLFLLYYSVPLFQGLMNREYLHHHCKLVSGIFLLSQDSISYAQLQSASDLLHSYVSDFARLYDLRYLGINFHQLLHLPEVVRNLGPLWVYNCFFLESLNGDLVQLFHGTQHVALQICSSVTMFLQLPVLVEELGHDTACYSYCKGLFRATKAVKIADEVNGTTFAVGTYKRPLEQVRSTRNLLTRFHIVGGFFNLFYRLRKDGFLYCSKEYSRISNRKESSFVQFTAENNTLNIGRIIRFVRWSNCTPDCATVCRTCNAQYYSVIEVFSRQVWLAQDLPDVRLSFVSKVVTSGRAIICSVAALHSLCFYYKVGRDEFVACPINIKEIE